MIKINKSLRATAAASLLFAVASGIYLFRTAPKPGTQEAPLQNAVAETDGFSPEPAAPSLADNPVSSAAAPAVAASTPAQAAATGSLAYKFKGFVQGQPLTRFAPAATEGPEKGRVMEMERLSVGDLGSWKEGQTVRLATPDGELSGLVNLVQADSTGWVRVGGSLQGQAGSFTLAAGPASSGGLLMLPSTGKAFEVVTEQDGRVLLVERRLADKRCFTNEVGAMRVHTQKAAAAVGTALAPQLLSSRPNAPAVIYMDFDGETVTDPAWNGGRTIVALAPAVSSDEIDQIFKRVSEDFAPFNVDVTTSLLRYNSVPPNRRTRCIVTPTNTAAPGSGGVAYIGAFNSAGTSFSADVPCWVFNGGVVGAAEAISHEVGHTMGLFHDGRTPSEEYFQGQGDGPTSWAPIMGVGYDKIVTQWSKGEYTRANNKQDDLALITQFANGITYITDEAGTSVSNAAPLMVVAGSINQPGLITGASDSDFFQFTSTGGSVAINAAPAAISPNLDIRLELWSLSTGTVVTSANPAGALGASLSANLPAGSYAVVVSGTGDGTATGVGYSAYGSLGQYTLTGTIAGVSAVPSITSSATSSAQLGTAFSYQIAATNSPTTYTILNALPSGVTYSTTTGLISGTPSATGLFPLVLKATNATGTSPDFTMTLTVAPAVLRLADAIDLPSSTVTSDGTAPWTPVTAGSLTFDGSDSAASGKITHSQTTSMKLTMAGPRKLSFRWKVSSEAGKDKLSLVVDNVVLESISGETAWDLRTIALSAGNHQVEWRYSKDASMSAGLDAGWVDTVSVADSDPLSLSGSFEFGKVSIGSSGTSNMTISNNSGAPITVTGITYPIGFSGAWSGVISGGSSKVVGVSFTPTVEDIYSGNVTVATSSGTLTQSVSGEGVVGVVNLVSGVTLTSQGAPTASTRVYKITVPTGSTALKVVTSGGTGDADLYLKKGVTPSPTDIDFKSEAAGSAELINVANPAADDWYILVYGYEEYAGMSITATVTAPSSSVNISVSSAGNGTVTGGGSYVLNKTALVRATPSAGYVFENWTEGGTLQSTSASYSFTVTGARTLVAKFTNVLPLVSGTAASGTLSNLSGAVGSQKFYKVTVPANTGLLSIKSSGGTGDVDLYLKRGASPTLTAFDYRSAKVGNAESLSVVNPIAGEWVVMVRGFKAYTRLTLRAVLTPKAAQTESSEDPKLTALKQMVGSYDGLLGDGAIRLLGRMDIRLMSGGAFSCRALLDGVAYSFTGKLDTEGHWKGFIKVGGVPMPVGLNADLVGQQIIRGSVGWDGIQYEVLAHRQALGAPDQAGTYAVTLWPNPDETGLSLPTYEGSNGSGTLVVKKDGAATLTGVLVDGTSVTASGHLSTDGKWAMYSPLYNRTGAIGGWWVFEPWRTGQSVKGSLRWSRDADDEAGVHKDGFHGLVTGQGLMVSP
jgi:hypothetical protein